MSSPPSKVPKFEEYKPTVSILSYGAGNIQSLCNAIEQIGFEHKFVKDPSEIEKAEILLFPGVGNFGHVCASLRDKGYAEPLKHYIDAGKPFMGICVGMQALFEGSEEAPDVPGLGVIPGIVRKFDDADKAVPCIGWNSAVVRDETDTAIYGITPHAKYYYVHTYARKMDQKLGGGWSVATAKYGTEEYVGAAVRENCLATQFHPEKSGTAGLKILEAFLKKQVRKPITGKATVICEQPGRGGLTFRVIACLDVRSNDKGDLVVTKGDQYDVREKDEAGDVRNLGKPVELASRYFKEGADEVTFLNITSFRNARAAEAPMLEVLRQAAKTVFVPMTVGGGIKDTTDPDGTTHSALDVARMYFDAGADKVSIGSDAVYAAEKYYANDKKADGTTALEAISQAYGNQAVVVSVDPKRRYVASPKDTKHHAIKTSRKGPNGEEYAWYQCTVSGGREARDLDVRQLVQAVEALGCGEILLNCMDQDGSNSGFDLELVADVKAAVKIPVIASSGAGKPEHFKEVFMETGCEAALAAGIFHRNECTIGDVKRYLTSEDLLVRQE
ncbi:imidazoleglycerol-phosphate synthase [Protomyces lactucae-debilis]|uniref:Imidazole glycerol phosphate synthase hisHF n=1 Tax=Protomyces lactucae-debilis TaxID=2754530 RepID=A0A1Y2FK56_PROLT|nr:imidazoleglycerol-phosphate synthase [Protomyces lactucae-debilis]ORY84338.1 imidazoleglycerol-phosphate synthase [Protomyces lactucae-debilis]